jgi:hypothetical protein
MKVLCWTDDYLTERVKKEYDSYEFVGSLEELEDKYESSDCDYVIVSASWFDTNEAAESFKNFASGLSKPFHVFLTERDLDVALVAVQVEQDEVFVHVIIDSVGAPLQGLIDFDIERLRTPR